MLHIYIYIYDISNQRVNNHLFGWFHICFGLFLPLILLAREINFQSMWDKLHAVKRFGNLTYWYQLLVFFFSVALQPYVGLDLLILQVSRSHTTTHHSR